MKKIFFVLFSLVGCQFMSSGCQVQHTPNLYNPLHWEAHLQKVFNPTYGSFHLLHLDMDSIVFGLENYEELEDTEYVYSE